MRKPTQARKLQIAADLREHYANLEKTVYSLENRISLVESEQSIAPPRVRRVVTRLVNRCTPDRVNKLVNDAVDNLPTPDIDIQAELLRQNTEFAELCEKLRNRITFLEHELNEARKAKEAA